VTAASAYFNRPGQTLTISVCACLLPQAYDELVKKLRELDALNGISGLLGWDEMVRQL
jgi:hypothetical protein